MDAAHQPLQSALKAGTTQTRSRSAVLRAPSAARLELLALHTDTLLSSLGPGRPTPGIAGRPISTELLVMLNDEFRVVI